MEIHRNASYFPHFHGLLGSTARFTEAWVKEKAPFAHLDSTPLARRSQVRRVDAMAPVIEPLLATEQGSAFSGAIKSPEGSKLVTAARIRLEAQAAEVLGWGSGWVDPRVAARVKT